MSQFAYFSGDVRRDRRQEAMMRSLNQRNQFIADMNLISEQRQIAENKARACRCIQKIWRVYRSMLIGKNNYRIAFDEIANTSQVKDILTVEKLLKLLVNFYDTRKDDDRLLMTLNEVVRLSRDEPAESDRILPHTRRLLLTKCCIQYLKKPSSAKSYFIVIRFLESFVFSNVTTFESSAKIGLYEAMLKLMESTMDESSKNSNQPGFTSKTQQILMRVLEPLKETKDNVLISEILMRKMVQALVVSLNENVFAFKVMPLFTELFKPNNINYSIFLSVVSDSKLDECHLKQEDLQRVKTRLCSLVVDQVRNFDDEGAQNMIGSFLRAISDCIKQSNFKKLVHTETEFEMEVNRDDTDFVLKQRIQSNLESAILRNKVNFYVNMENVDIRVVVELKDHILDTTDTLAKSDYFLRSLYNLIKTNNGSEGQFEENGKNVNLVKSALVIFCTCLTKKLATTPDSDFEADRIIDDFEAVLKFLRNTCLKLIILLHPEYPSGINQLKKSEVKERQKALLDLWSEVCNAVRTTLQAVYEKDNRMHFLHEDFWSDHGRSIIITKWNNETSRRRHRRNMQPSDVAFVEHLSHAYQSDSDSDNEEEGRVQLNQTGVRNLVIMKTIPFLVPFMQRIRIFGELLTHDKNKIGAHILGMGRSISLRVHRETMYSDAYLQLQSETGRGNDLRLPIRVTMINHDRLLEAGIDGGGIFREFLNEVLKQGFDVNQGLFVLTDDQLLVPNPSAMAVYESKTLSHFNFLGKLLGRLLYERQLIELRFAEFFIAQLFEAHGQSKNIDLQHMRSYDAQLYKHLKGMLYLSAPEIDKLDLDFSVMVQDVGNPRPVNLKYNGSSIRVNIDNVQEYVRLYVNHQLKIRFAPFISAMKQGVNEVINVEWLSMFSSSEIQNLIAGTEEVFSIQEMRRYCNVNNAQPEDAVLVEWFWDVVENFSPDNKKALLKFITGCSRPPIEGFRAMDPPLGMNLLSETDSLPTSHTCMNLLKIPRYTTREKLEQKLLYAINSGAGFELA